MEPEVDDEAVPHAVVPGTARPSRSAKRIVAAVATAAVVLAALAWWVLVVPYRVDATGSGQLDCDVVLGRTDEQTWDDIYRTDPASLDDCRSQRQARRNTALLVGAGVAIAACAVSTVPSRRLTGDKLGPLR